MGQQLRITPPAWSAGTGAAFVPQNSLVWESRGCSSVLPAALGLGCCWQFVPWGEAAAQGTINSSFLPHPLPWMCFPSELHRWVWEAGGKLVSVSPHLWHFPDLELLALSSHGEKLNDGRIPTVHLKPGPAPGWFRSSCLPPPGNSCTVSNAAITPLTHFLPLFKSVPAGKFQTTNPFFPLILLQGPRGGCRLRWPQFPPGPLCRDKEPRVPVAVSSGRVPWLWPRGMLRMALCSLFLIAGPRQLVKGSALCPPVPAALGRARAQPLRADFGVTYKTSLG